MNRKAREEIRRYSITSAGPATKPPQEAKRLGEGAHAQVDAVLDPQQLGGPRAARAQHARAVSLVDHQPRAVALAELADVAQRRDVALHREDAVDDDQHAAAVGLRTVEHLLQLVEAVVAERRAAWRAESRQPSRIEAWSPESTITVSEGPSIVPSVPRLAWWPVVNTSASSVSIHSAISRSSSRCSGIVPFSRREPVSPVP